MVNKCVLVNCVSGYETGEKKSSFHILEDKGLNENWLASKNSVICIDHYEKKLTRHGKKNVNKCGN